MGANKESEKMKSLLKMFAKYLHAKKKKKNKKTMRIDSNS